MKQYILIQFDRYQGYGSTFYYFQKSEKSILNCAKKALMENEDFGDEDPFEGLSWTTGQNNSGELFWSADGEEVSYLIIPQNHQCYNKRYRLFI